jgi:hypothetical protein
MGTMGAGPVASCRSVIALSTPGLDSRPRKPSIRRIAPRGSAASSRWWTSGKRSSPRRALAPTSGAGLSWASRATLSSSTSRPWRKSPGPKSDRPGRRDRLGYQVVATRMSFTVQASGRCGQRVLGHFLRLQATKGTRHSPAARNGACGRPGSWGAVSARQPGETGC